jgi:predicted PurR-regulated permease PerM
VPNWWERFRRGNPGRRPSPGVDKPTVDDTSDGSSATADQEMTDDMASSAAELELPLGIRIAGAWAWRLLVVGAAIFVLTQLIGILAIVVIPFAISLLLAALLHGPVRWLRQHRVPKSLATAIVMVGGVAAVSAVLYGVVQAFLNGLPGLTDNVVAGINEAKAWLVHPPLNLSQAQIDAVIANVGKTLSENQSAIASGALTATTTVTEIVSGLFIVLFTTFFLLRDGANIWRFLTNLLPRKAVEPVREAGVQSWRTLHSYVRATVLVAFVDAFFIGLGVAIMGVPLALPLAAVIFLGAFVPVIGAFISGSVAVLVALVAKGPIAALIVLAILVAVQQLESHILQPFLLGRAVSLHPLAVILAIATGLVISGIIGALVAVPLLAVTNTAVRSLASRRARKVDPPPGTMDLKVGQSPA